MFTKLQRLSGASSRQFSTFGRMAIATITLAIMFTTSSNGAFGTNIFDFRFSDVNATANILIPPVIVTAPTVTRPVLSTFSIPITVSDVTGDGIFGFQFIIDYAPGVIDPSGSNFGCSTAGTLAGDAGISPTCNVAPDGTLRISAFNLSGSMTGSGTLINLTFTTDPSAVSGNVSPITFQEAKLFNNGGQVSNTPVNGQVTLAAPSITATNTATGAEPGTANSFAVTISNSLSVPITVNYATGGGSATAGSDYTATSGTLTFPANTAVLTRTQTKIGTPRRRGRAARRLRSGWIWIRAPIRTSSAAPPRIPRVRR